MLQNQQVASNITTNDQIVHVYDSWKSENSTLTLKCLEKIVNIFFLKIRIYFSTRKYMFDTFTKNAHGITQRPMLVTKCLHNRIICKPYLIPLSMI